VLLVANGMIDENPTENHVTWLLTRLSHVPLEFEVTATGTMVSRWGFCWEDRVVRNVPIFNIDVDGTRQPYKTIKWYPPVKNRGNLT
jgi:hypothetical protein